MGLRSISDHIVDIAQNAIESGGKKGILEITETPNKSFTFIVKDDGRGMSKEKLEKVMDPFYTEKNKKIKFGLGLPILKQAVEMTGGNFEISSEVGVGTKVKAEFILSNIDCQPIGDLPGSLMTVLSLKNDFDWSIQRTRGEEGYSITTGELTKLMGRDFIHDPLKLKIIIEIINEAEKSLGGSANEE